MQFSCLTPNSIQILLQRFALDEVYDKVPMLAVGEVAVHTREVGMREVRQKEHFAIEGVGGIDNLLWFEVTQIDFLDSNQSIIALDVLRFVDCAKAALPYGTYNSIAISK